MTSRRSILQAAVAFSAVNTAGPLTVALSLAGCGGGVGTGGTGDFSSNFTYGQITGFGSVIVSGVRFDDSDATVVDDRGVTRSSDSLRLGMTVSVDSAAITQDTSGRQAKASVVRFGSVVEGPVTSVDTVNSSFVVLGQTVRVGSTTVFDDSLGAGLSALSASMAVEVHGYVDVATRSIIATRVERQGTTTEYKARGVIVAVDATGRTLRIGNADFDYAAATGVPSDLSVGRVVTVYVQLASSSAGRFVVSRFNSASISAPSGDHDSCDIRGVVTAFTDTRRFSVNDTIVDASSATFPDGTAFALGSRVKVEGRFEAGVLIAREVEIDSDDRVRGEGIDLRGAIESVDTASQTFRLRGNTVFYGGNVRFDDGGIANLIVGASVRVKGVLSADRTRVNATEIKFE